jgi:hypothetical protein
MQESTDETFETSPWAHKLDVWLQHVGQWLMVAVILAAMLGLFGGSEVLVVELDDAEPGRTSATMRQGTKYSLRFVAPLDDGASELRLVIAQGYLDAMEVVGVLPQPRQERVVPGGVEYVIEASPEARRVEVAFELHPRDLGVHEGEARAGRFSAAWRHLVLP